MYRGAMEPTWASGGCPGGGCADLGVLRILLHTTETECKLPSY